MKKRVIKIAALVVLFAAVLVISNVILNRGNDDQVVDMGDATLPIVSFMMGTEINALSGYVDDMDIAAMRDTITPLESDGTLKMQIEKNDNQIREISYSLFSGWNRDI